jgi:DNA-binding transcriptional MerR regulator
VSSSRELIKLYYRIGEVAHIVGVEPHVLRYWETEFRSIRPQKSHKGQRVYSRRDVEKLLRVKDLLKNQGFTIAGARKKLREPEARVESEVAPPVVRADPAKMREALSAIREDIVAMLEELDAPSPPRPRLPGAPRHGGE